MFAIHLISPVRLLILFLTTESIYKFTRQQSPLHNYPQTKSIPGNSHQTILSSNVINRCDSYQFPELIFTKSKQLEEANYSVIVQVNDTSLQAGARRSKDGAVRKAINQTN